MKTRDEFIRRWKKVVAGTITLGTSKARVVLVGAFTGNSSAEAVLAELDSTTEELLGRLYDDLLPPAPKADGQANGIARAVKDRFPTPPHPKVL